MNWKISRENASYLFADTQNTNIYNADKRVDAACIKNNQDRTSKSSVGESK
jgi:hypothetical protein